MLIIFLNQHIFDRKSWIYFNSEVTLLIPIIVVIANHVLSVFSTPKKELRVRARVGYGNESYLTGKVNQVRCTYMKNKILKDFHQKYYNLFPRRI